MLGSLVGGRMGPTFIRMIAFAMGGAKTLAVIKTREKVSASGEPNWPLVARAYGTLGSLSLVLAVVSLGVGIAVGYFPTLKIAESGAQPQEIWWAFAIMLGTGFISMAFQNILVALKGMNYVALVNRWSMVFSLLSVGAGFVALSQGANIWQLALVMQGVKLLNLTRLTVTLIFVADKRFRSFRPWVIDREIISWAWPPFWRIMALSFAGAGLIQLAAAYYVNFVTIEEAASFLFTLKIILSLRKISDAPFASHTPRMARLLAEGKVDSLRKTVQSKISQQTIFFSLGILGLLLAGNPLLVLIKANAKLLDPSELVYFSVPYQLQYYIVSHLLVAQLGNHIICFKRQLLAGLLSVSLIYILIPDWKLAGLILACFLPFFILVRWTPIKESLVRLNDHPGTHLWKTAASPACIWSLIFMVLIVKS